MLHKIGLSLNLKEKEFGFSIAYLLFSAARMGIGATLIKYLTNKGVSLSEIAALKLIQGAVVFACELPTGFFADRYGRRLSCLIAASSGVLSFICFYFGDSFWVFATAEVFNALTISFWSGAFVSLVVDSYGETSKAPGFLESLFSKFNIFASLGTMFSGLLGGFLFDLDQGYPFLFSSSVMIFAIFALIFLVKEKKIRILTADSENSRNMFTWVRLQALDALRLGLLNKKIRLFFYIQILVQFAMQPLLHYWQPYFLELESNLTGAFLGNLFFAYVGAQFTSSVVVKLLIKRDKSVVEKLVYLEIIILCFAFVLLGSSSSFYLALVAFLLAQGCSASFRSLLEADLNRRISEHSRATVISTVSFVSRIGMLAALFMFSRLLTQIELRTLFFISAVAVALILILYRLWVIDRSEEVTGT